MGYQVPVKIREVEMQGSDLREIRKRLAMTQAELAAALDLSPQFIGMMERGEKPIEKRTELAVLYIAYARK
jgi:DNA-binding XRE family transcriptional regulator